MADREASPNHDSIVRELLRSAELSRDALPYTPEFSRMKATFLAQTGERLRDHDFWRLLTRVGKKGGVAGSQRRKRPAGPPLTSDQEFELLRLFPDGIGSRDSLPYSPKLDAYHTRFLRLTSLELSKQDFWRAISNIAKRSKKPEPIKGPLPLAGLPKELIDSLLDQNPWWSGQSWERTEPYRRWAYRELVRKVDSGIAKIIAIRGTRQVGKSAIQRQFIEELLLQREVPPSHILRVQFDDVKAIGQFESPILTIVRWFEASVLKESINAAANRDETVYLFLDELQNISDWANQLKELVDHRSVKVIATGSSALRIAQGQDSLAGRISMIRLGPLRLREIAALRFAETLPPAVATENGLMQWATPEFWRHLLNYAELHDDLLRRSFGAFANFGGYPICHKLKEDSQIDGFDLHAEIKDMVVHRTFEHDLKAGPKGTHRSPETLEAVFRQVCRYTGQALTSKALLKELMQLGQHSISQDAVNDAVAFLADSLLVSEIPPFEGLGKKGGHPSKLCLCDHFVREAWLQEQVPLVPDEMSEANEATVTQAGHLAESLVGAFFSGVPGLAVSWLPGNDNEGEIDFVLTIGLKRIPVEVKYRRKLKPEDSAAVRSFISQPKYNAPFGIVVTQAVADEKDNVFYVPLHALLGLR